MAGDIALDEAFLSLASLARGLVPALEDLVDDEAGVRTRLTQVEVTSPIELDVQVDGAGAVWIGGVPPLYREETSFLPVFHSIRLLAVREEER